MTRPSRMRQYSLLVMLILFAMAALLGGTLRTAWLRNRLALQTIRVMVGNAPPPAVLPLPGTDNSANWLLGFLENRRRGQISLNPYWERAIAADRYHVKFLHSLYPADQTMAEAVKKILPDSAESWFWLAELQTDISPADAIRHYRRGLELEPQDGTRWLALAMLLQESDDLPAAMEAFYQACIHGDPGYNGCLNAGILSARLGDPENAIRYYRMSRWPPAWERARQLENETP